MTPAAGPRPTDAVGRNTSPARLSHLDQADVTADVRTVAGGARDGQLRDQPTGGGGA